MNVLALDTSGPVCGVALLQNDRILCEFTVQNKLTHSVNLMPMVDQALASAGLALTDLDRLAVVVGPGSFTGVRIGVSTAKGLAHGAGLPCAAVNALEAMAAGVAGFPAILCPIQDARAGQVYSAAFDPAGKRLLPDKPMKLEEFLETVQSLGERFLFLGDGMPVHQNSIRRLLGERAVFAPPQHAYLRPSAVAVLGARAESTVDYLSLMPLYLRAPSAERNKKLVEASKHA